MADYVSRIELLVNGQLIADFKAVAEKPVRRHEAVELMNKTGHRKRTPRYGVTVDYAVPETVPFDWSSIGSADATLTIVTEGGLRRRYSGLHIIEEGEARYDEDNDCIQTIDLSAESRDPK